MPDSTTHLTAVKVLLEASRRSRRAVCAFNVSILEHAEAIVSGAEAAQRPVILQISQNAVRYHDALEPLLRATLTAAEQAPVPAIVHLDHADDRALISRAVELGIHSVMYDGSVLPYDENVETTRLVVDECHAAGVFVEAELGEVGGKDGVHAPGARTRPDEAAGFVDATNVDALAVAVGTSHAMTTREAHVDADLIATLATAVPVPLVLHGSSGLIDAELTRAVLAGMTKINISTHLNGIFTREVRAVLDGNAEIVDPRMYLSKGRAAVAAEVTRILRLLS